MKKFEYEFEFKKNLSASGQIWFENNYDEEMKKRLTRGKEFEEELLVFQGIEIMGEKGWELCGISNDIYYFKREKNNFK